MKWTKLIPADFSSNSPHFTINLGAFPCTFLFRKEPFKCMGDYESTPQILFEKDPQNSNSERVRKIEGFFLRANLIVRPTLKKEDSDL